MNRIKNDNAEIKMQDKDIMEMRKIVENYQRSIKEIENELKGGNAAGNKSEDA